MYRVVTALKQYAPSHVEIVAEKEEADVEVLHAIGFPEIADRVDEVRHAGKRYAIIQYCLRTTQLPSTRDWLPLWKSAEVVWSYYDLYALMNEDMVVGRFNFYDAPLGCDETVFKPIPAETKIYALMTSGYVAEPECIEEAILATKIIGGNHFHLGPTMTTQTHVTHALGIPDSLLAKVYRKTQHVAGLRRIEGFELPAVEGLFCGARPILFDKPHYRRWFDGLARFINEGASASVTNQLTAVLSVPHPVQIGEYAHATERFNWARIARNFWAALDL